MADKVTQPYVHGAATRAELKPADQEIFDLAYQVVQYQHDNPDAGYCHSLCYLWDAMDIPHSMIRWMALEQWGQDHPR